MECQRVQVEIAGIHFFQIARQQLMQLGAGGVGDALICHFLGDNMFEKVCQFGIGGIERCEVQLGEFRQMIFDNILRAERRIIAMQPGKWEHASDDARHLQCDP